MKKKQHFQEFDRKQIAPKVASDMVEHDVQVPYLKHILDLPQVVLSQEEKERERATEPRSDVANVRRTLRKSKYIPPCWLPR